VIPDRFDSLGTSETNPTGLRFSRKYGWIRELESKPSSSIPNSWDSISWFGDALETQANRD
jgi:hypothetical protein